MSSNVMRWCIHIKNMQAMLGIGIHPHEKNPQRILVNAKIECLYTARPKSIDECFNYDHVNRLVNEEWPKRGHVDLLESCVVEFMEHIFLSDDSVDKITVSITKPDIFKDTESVGVEAQWTREDYKKHKAAS